MVEIGNEFYAAQVRREMSRAVSVPKAAIAPVEQSSAATEQQAMEVVRKSFPASGQMFFTEASRDRQLRMESAWQKSRM